MNSIEGIVISGHGVASGKGKDSRYPEGTLILQMPFFKAKGLDLSHYYKGTINIDIAPYHYAIKTPTHYIEGVDWSPYIPPENFYFFQLQLEFKGQLYDGIIYMPDPKTKVDHHQLATMLEVMMPPIPGIQGGEKVRLFIPEGSLELTISE